MTRSDDGQDKRIEELKRRAQELCGDDPMEATVNDDCPADAEEGFWRQVVDFEEAPWTTHFNQLESAGVSLPPPNSLDDRELTARLWEVIQKLALLRVFLSQTDHLSDRELYTHLWTDSLREETKLLPFSSHSACHIQMLGGCSEEDNRLYVKYYADEDSRRRWHEHFADEPLPAHKDPPYDRDRLLPQAEYSPPIEGEPN